jgi:ferrochelatase
MKSGENKIAVVLFQLGGPDSIESIQPFLYNLFSDPDIINFPGAFLARRYIAKLISLSRAKIVAMNYQQIGGRSPIIDLTFAQANELQKKLDAIFSAKVFVAMRYWHPSTEEVVRELKKERFSKVILLPLYPQYCKATTASSLNEWNRICIKMDYQKIQTKFINSFHDHPLYVEAIADNINIAYSKFSQQNAGNIDLVFSAHGVPVSYIEAGDPYQKQIEETIQLVVNKGQWESPHYICYQSKVGPMKWLKPSLKDMITRLASAGRKNILVIPIAFVTEHIETLHEINIEARKEALHLGITQFEMMPALNSHPKFIQCLSELVLNRV